MVAGTPLPLNIVLASEELRPAAYDVDWVSKSVITAKNTALDICFPNIVLSIPPFVGAKRKAKMTKRHGNSSINYAQ
ncbi:unannotated protein [freshwater metagenome]|uniref:Unannotated protein n=1 Tax=freshwater metagenome TaxID=449393 RepID=A0A6J6D152_9ZZZZ